MCNVLFALSIFLLIVSPLFAQESQDHSKPPAAKSQTTEAVEVRNKICPVSGNSVDDPSMGGLIKHEYKGKIYNLCCEGCVSDFEKDPEKYSAIAEKEGKL